MLSIVKLMVVMTACAAACKAAGLRPARLRGRC